MGDWKYFKLRATRTFYIINRVTILDGPGVPKWFFRHCFGERAQFGTTWVAATVQPVISCYIMENVKVQPIIINITWFPLHLSCCSFESWHLLHALLRILTKYKPNSQHRMFRYFSFTCRPLSTLSHPPILPEYSKNDLHPTLASSR